MNPIYKIKISLANMDPKILGKRDTLSLCSVKLESARTVGDFLTIDWHTLSQSHTHVNIFTTHILYMKLETHAALLMYNKFPLLFLPPLVSPPAAMPSLVISPCTSPCLPPTLISFPALLTDWSSYFMAQLGTKCTRALGLIQMKATYLGRCKHTVSSSAL